LQSPGRTLDGPTRTQERPIQANSASANELTRPVAPRRPFLVALAGTAMLAAVEFTPPRAVETPSLSAVIAAGAPAQASHILVRPTVAPVDSASLERDVVSRYSYRPLALLLTGVLLTENPRLETTSVSSQGAIGLMQVMDFHAGTFDCESDDLLQVEANICHGARVFGRYLKRTGNVQRALLRYNGCVVSANTPNCHRYPAKVTQAARQVRRELLLYRASFRSDSAQ
jgi:hypothetical protein